MPKVQIKRAYDPPARADGMRVLVDRLWPRGVRKEALKHDLWLKDVAPSSELRTWFGHDPEKWDKFKLRYLRELDGSAALDELKKLAGRKKITLLYGAKDSQHNHAVILCALVNGTKI